MRKEPVHAHRQQGVTLAVGLVLLLLMTMLGAYATQSSSIQQQMSGNMEDKELSFQATESALREGENWLGSQVNQPSDAATCTQPCVLTYDPTRYLKNKPLRGGAETLQRTEEPSPR